MIVNLVAIVVDKNDKLVDGYVQKQDMPFVPTLGMKFKGGTSTWLWETENGSEIDPRIQEIVYNLYEKQVYCLFKINEALANSCWTHIQDIHNSYELTQFETHKQKYEEREEDLEPLMKEVLPMFISDSHYISKIEKTYDKQQAYKIKKAIAECIDRNYTTNYDYLKTQDDIVFAYFGINFAELSISGEKFLSDKK